MAKAGLAPKAFAYVDKKGRPLRCFYLSFAFALLAYLAELQQDYTVFLWLLSACGLASIISWASICATHIRFHQALRIHKKPWNELPYQSPLGIIGSWFGLFCNLFIILLQFITAAWPVGFHGMTPKQRAQYFFQNFTAFILIAIVYLGFKFFKGTKVEGVNLSWKGVSFDKPSIKREGTVPVNLSTDVDFTGSWELGDWFEYARLHPERVVREEPLWWCPGPLRALITFFEFPWRWRTSPVVPGILATNSSMLV
jgi:amino acid transporter